MKTIGFFIILITLSSAGLILYQYYKFNDGKLRIVFCNVGQGDAIFIRTPKGSDILYDGGPDKEVLSCLTEQMPFWDRTVELMLLSHPHADHLIGLMAVLKRYNVLSFNTEELSNETAMYTALIDLLKKQQTNTRFVLAGDQFRTKDGVKLQILSPTRKYLQETSPGGVIGERKEFASLIVQVSYGDFDVLLTGDSQIAGLDDGLGKFGELGRLAGLEVLQVPHHGSRTGLDTLSVSRLSPKLAVISVGKNTYGHPSKEIIKRLGDQNIKILRTDKEGDIEIISDGKTWWVE